MNMDRKRVERFLSCFFPLENKNRKSKIEKSHPPTPQKKKIKKNRPNTAPTQSPPTSPDGSPEREACSVALYRSPSSPPTESSPGPSLPLPGSLMTSGPTATRTTTANNDNDNGGASLTSRRSTTRWMPPPRLALQLEIPAASAAASAAAAATALTVCRREPAARSAGTASGRRCRR